jgi:ABC-type uncharacterized transport system permease subunit
MDLLTTGLQFLLPVLYFGTIWAYARAFFSSIKEAESIKTPLLVGTIAFHVLFILLRSAQYGHPPITSIFEILSLIALTVALVYALIELKTKNTSTGYFILIFPFFFQLLSSLFLRELTEIPAVLRSNLLGFHVFSALFGYAAITISAVYGFLYLMLYHDIKSRHFSVIYKRLPNLEMLERMSFTATLSGFLLLTVAIGVGLIWLPRAIVDYSYADPKLLGSVAIWCLYAVGLAAKKLAGWQGRRIMVFSVAGFAIALFSMSVVNIFFTGFHKFY